MKNVKAWIKENISGLRWIASAITVWAVMHFVLAVYIVPSESMESTIMTKDIVIATRIGNTYERGDIIAFHPPIPGRESEHWVKRIIAVGGETVEIRGDQVYIDGQLLDEPYKNEPMDLSNDFYFVVPENCYFVMGDNRNNSKDSRFWDDPFVQESAIVAKIQFGIFPFRTY